HRPPAVRPRGRRRWTGPRRRRALPEAGQAPPGPRRGGLSRRRPALHAHLGALTRAIGCLTPRSASQEVHVTRFPKERAPGWFLTRDAPDDAIPEEGLPAIQAMRLVQQELAIEGIPERNLATFVTTWMED